MAYALMLLNINQITEIEVNTFKDAKTNYDWKQTPEGSWILHFGEVVVGTIQKLTIPNNADQFIMNFKLPYHQHIHGRMIKGQNGSESGLDLEDLKNKLLNCSLYWFQLALKKI